MSKQNNRGLKTRTSIGNSVDTALWTLLDELSTETMIPKSKLLDRGMELVLIEYGKIKKDGAEE